MIYQLVVQSFKGEQELHFSYRDEALRAFRIAASNRNNDDIALWRDDPMTGNYQRIAHCENF